jgi:cytidylate kinase
MGPVIVMGVSGCGKTSVGAALAELLGLPFIEGDKLHPAANIAKMSAGIALEALVMVTRLAFRPHPPHRARALVHH